MSDDINIQSPLNRALTDKFYFLMNLPSALKNLREKYVQNIKEVGIKRESIGWALTKVSTPEINIKAQSIPYAGGNHYISSHVKEPYSPLTIEFKVDNRYANYTTIYEWINYIYDEKYGHFDANNLSPISGIDTYATTVSIVAMDEYNEDVMMWTFKNAFPTKISSLSLDYTTADEMTCSVDFVFSQMYVKNFNLSK